MIDDVTSRIERLEAELIQAANKLPVMDTQELTEKWPAIALVTKRATLRRSITRIEVRRGELPLDERMMITPRF